MLKCVRGVPVVKHNEMGTAEPERGDLTQIILFHGAVIFENQMHFHTVTQTHLTSRVTSSEESVNFLYDP
jgi:hypothetical protein